MSGGGRFIFSFSIKAGGIVPSPKQEVGNLSETSINSDQKQLK